jgi:hypothetical protein
MLSVFLGGGGGYRICQQHCVTSQKNNATPCSLIEVYCCFGGACCLHCHNITERCAGKDTGKGEKENGL